MSYERALHAVEALLVERLTSAPSACAESGCREESAGLDPWSGNPLCVRHLAPHLWVDHPTPPGFWAAVGRLSDEWEQRA